MTPAQAARVFLAAARSMAGVSPLDLMGLGTLAGSPAPPPELLPEALRVLAQGDGPYAHAAQACLLVRPVERSDVLPVPPRAPGSRWTRWTWLPLVPASPQFVEAEALVIEGAPPLVHTHWVRRALAKWVQSPGYAPPGDPRPRVLVRVTVPWVELGPGVVMALVSPPGELPFPRGILAGLRVLPVHRGVPGHVSLEDLGLVGHRLSVAGSPSMFPADRVLVEAYADRPGEGGGPLPLDGPCPVIPSTPVTFEVETTRPRDHGPARFTAWAKIVEAEEDPCPRP